MLNTLRVTVPLTILTALCAAAPAKAAELFGGVYKHAVHSPFSLEGGRERGVDLQLGFRGGRLFPRLGLQPYAFGAFNTAGDTSYAAAGLSWRFGKTVYVRPGLGLAIHDGSAGKFDDPSTIALGSRILFEPELGVGYQLNDRASFEAHWVHLSQATLFSRQNPGIDNVGARVNWRF